MATVSSRELIAAGFQQLERAGGFLEDSALSGVDPAALVATLRVAPDPDEALLLIIRLIERAPAVRELFGDADTGRYPSALPLIRLLGASQALGEFLIRHPEQVDLLFEPTQVAEMTDPQASHDPPRVASQSQLRSTLLESVGARPDVPTPVASLEEDFTAAQAGAALRIAYRREVTRLALRDLCAPDPESYLPAVTRQLADAASAAIEAALAVTRAEHIARDPEAGDVELAVIGMGKTGARELNYISDVDVVFVHRAPEEMDEVQARHHAVSMASGITRVIGSSEGEPGLWEVDANLRPEGKDGVLSRTLASHQEYYRRWASGWEFQALLKARPIAGSVDLGQEYLETIWPLVWQSSAREGFVEDVQAMRRRVYANIPAKDAEWEIKLGRGGLRDIEFTVQLLQLVHGRVDSNVHIRDTLSAIRALGEGEYVSSRDQEAMSRCYRRLRLYEHRIQLRQMRRTHMMPQRPELLRALAHSVRPPSEPRRQSPDDVLDAWRKTVREVSTFHQTIFYRPLLSTTAVLDDDDVKLSAEAVQARLSALGYQDTGGALRHIEALTSGVSRRATLQRRILPAMLGWLAEGVDPDQGLLAFRRISESLGMSPWYLTMLRDSSMAAERLSYILSSSRFISEMLEHLPESAQWLGDDDMLVPRSFESMWNEVRHGIARHEGTDAAARVPRMVRQREQLRIAIAEACRQMSTDQVGRALAEVDRVAVLGALRVAEDELFSTEERAAEFLVVAMGRQGGREISYGSDMDAMFVHRAVDAAGRTAADAQAQKLAQRLTQLLSKSVKPPVRGEHALQMDADLRPEGKQGPLSRSLDSYAEYYTRWMEIWERQALLRARPMAGSDALSQDFLELMNSVRYGEPPSSSDERQIRRIKARVESERLPRGADPARHVKLGRGGLSDVEWLVQLLQLQHGHHHPVLRGTSTMSVLNSLVDRELLSPDDANTLSDAWQLCTQVRSGIIIWSGKPGDVLPSARRDLEAVSRWCGFDSGQAAAFEDHYLRTTRRARQVFERLFYET